MNRRLRATRQRILWISLIPLLVALMLGGMQLSTFGSRPAQAATQLATSSSILSAGPATAIDYYGNHFVFWRGTDPGHGLWEGFYEASAAKWYGPNPIAGMGSLGSEPTVAVDSGNVSQGYAYQYVFWKGNDGGLWEAYWDGSWHGPINLGMGILGSKPSATYNNSTGALTVVWKGMDGNLWYTSTQINPSGQQGSWQQPPSSAPSWGHLGGAPTMDANWVFWRGQDGYLWYGQFHWPTNFPEGPYELKQSGLLGSDPSATGFIANGEGDVSWSGIDGGLWTLRWNTLGPNDSPQGIPNTAPLGSAPSCALQTVNNFYFCYWAGATAGADLWEASYDFTVSHTGNPKNLGMGPLE